MIFEAVKKAIDQIRQRTENKKRLDELEEKINLTLDEMRKKFLLDMISRSLSEKDQIKNKMKSLNLSFFSYYILAFEIENTQCSMLLVNYNLNLADIAEDRGNIYKPIFLKNTQE